MCNNASVKNGVLFGQATEGAIIAVGLKVVLFCLCYLQCELLSSNPLNELHILNLKYTKFIIICTFQLGLVRLNEEFERLEEIPFTSDTKWMAVKCRKAFSGNHEVVITSMVC